MRPTLLLILLLVHIGVARTNYVSLHGLHIPPFTNWITAATNIQDAVDVAQDGDVVLVSNGLYNSGSRVSPNASLHSRVVITNAITVQSLNGPEVTVIAGAADPSTGAAGSNAVRGVYLSGGAHLCGFTVSNGHILQDGVYEDFVGAGVYVADKGHVRESRISDNYAEYSLAAGLYAENDVIIENAVFTRNFAALMAGAFASNAQYRNILAVSNGAYNVIYPTGIVCLEGAIDNVTSVLNGGAGLGISPPVSVWNTVAWGNQRSVHEAEGTCTAVFFSCIQNWTRLDHGTISNDPQFVDAAAGDFRLLDTSPCINAGTNMPWMWAAVDLDGNPRIQHDVVDMGCYESAVPEPGALGLLIGFTIWVRRCHQDTKTRRGGRKSECRDQSAEVRSGRRIAIRE